VSYISDDVTDDSLLTWAKTLRDDKKLLHAVADLLDSIFSKAAAEYIINGKVKPPHDEYVAVMRFLEKLGGFKYKP
jgi:hypothetical protein